MKHLLLIFLTILSSTTAFAQDRLSWQSIVEFLNNASDGTNTDDILTEDLYEIYCSPLDINNITSEDLQIFSFLTYDQCKDVIFYRDTHYPLYSLGELIYVTCLSKQERALLSAFCMVSQNTIRQDSTSTHKSPNLKLSDFRKLLKKSKHEIALRTDIPFYTKSGQMSYSDSILDKYPNRQYQDNRFAHNFRYTLTSLNHLYIGIKLEKDAGERYFDHISGYAMLKNISLGKNVIIKELIGGTFRSSFGLGLTVNTGYNYGKIQSLSRLMTIDRGLSRHTSTSESGYFTGGGLRLQFRRLTFTAFGAYNNIDGTLNSDSTSVSSLKTDGLHRTPLEISKKGNLHATNYGANIHWDINSHIQVSASAFGTHLSLPLSPKSSTPSTLYNRYSPQGQDYQAYSISYAYHSTKLDITGETAVSHQDSSTIGLASLLAIQYRINSKNTLTLVGRSYGAKYRTLYSRAFSENSTPHNEQGIYLGWSTRLIRNVTIDTYADFIYFPWLKYHVNNKSYGIDYLLQLTYTPNSSNSIFFRYRMKSKEENSDTATIADFMPLTFANSHTFKLQHNLKLSSNWQLRTLINTTLHKKSPTPLKTGFSISETARFTHDVYRKKLPFNLDLSLTYFNTDSYDTRVYAIEPSLLYSYGTASYYGKGFRTILRASIPVISDLFVNLRFSMTNYFDRDFISSNTEKIDANHREDLQLQVRYKF